MDTDTPGIGINEFQHDVASQHMREREILEHNERAMWISPAEEADPPLPPDALINVRRAKNRLIESSLPIGTLKLDFCPSIDDADALEPGAMKENTDVVSRRESQSLHSDIALEEDASPVFDMRRWPLASPPPQHSPRVQSRGDMPPLPPDAALHVAIAKGRVAKDKSSIKRVSDSMEDDVVPNPVHDRPRMPHSAIRRTRPWPTSTFSQHSHRSYSPDDDELQSDYDPPSLRRTVSTVTIVRKTSTRPDIDRLPKMPPPRPKPQTMAPPPRPVEPVSSTENDWSTTFDSLDAFEPSSLDLLGEPKQMKPTSRSLPRTTRPDSSTSTTQMSQEDDSVESAFEAPLKVPPTPREPNKTSIRLLSHNSLSPEPLSPSSSVHRSMMMRAPLTPSYPLRDSPRSSEPTTVRSSTQTVLARDMREINDVHSTPSTPAPAHSRAALLMTDSTPVSSSFSMPSAPTQSMPNLSSSSATSPRSSSPRTQLPSTAHVSPAPPPSWASTPPSGSPPASPPIVQGPAPYPGSYLSLMERVKMASSMNASTRHLAARGVPMYGSGMDDYVQTNQVLTSPAPAEIYSTGANVDEPEEHPVGQSKTNESEAPTVPSKDSVWLSDSGEGLGATVPPASGPVQTMPTMASTPSQPRSVPVSASNTFAMPSSSAAEAPPPPSMTGHEPAGPQPQGAKLPQPLPASEAPMRTSEPPQFSWNIMPVWPSEAVDTAKQAIPEEVSMADTSSATMFVRSDSELPTDAMRDMNLVQETNEQAPPAHVSEPKPLDPSEREEQPSLDEVAWSLLRQPNPETPLTQSLPGAMPSSEQHERPESNPFRQLQSSRDHSLAPEADLESDARSSLYTDVRTAQMMRNSAGAPLAQSDVNENANAVWVKASAYDMRETLHLVSSKSEANVRMNKDTPALASDYRRDEYTHTAPRLVDDLAPTPRPSHSVLGAQTPDSDRWTQSAAKATPPPVSPLPSVPIVRNISHTPMSTPMASAVPPEPQSEFLIDRRSKTPVNASDSLSWTRPSHAGQLSPPIPQAPGSPLLSMLGSPTNTHYPSAVSPTSQRAFSPLTFDSPRVPSKKLTYPPGTPVAAASPKAALPESIKNVETPPISAMPDGASPKSVLSTPYRTGSSSFRKQGVATPFEPSTPPMPIRAARNHLAPSSLTDSPARQQQTAHPPILMPGGVKDLSDPLSDSSPPPVQFYEGIERKISKIRARAHSPSQYPGLQPQHSHVAPFELQNRSLVFPAGVDPRNPGSGFCVECMMRDEDMADVTVMDSDVWERASDADFYEAMKVEESIRARNKDPMQMPEFLSLAVAGTQSISPSTELTQGNLREHTTTSRLSPATKARSIFMFVSQQRHILGLEADDAATPSTSSPSRSQSALPVMPATTARRAAPQSPRTALDKSEARSITGASDARSEQPGRRRKSSETVRRARSTGRSQPASPETDLRSSSRTSGRSTPVRSPRKRAMQAVVAPTMRGEAPDAEADSRIEVGDESMTSTRAATPPRSPSGPSGSTRSMRRPTGRSASRPDVPKQQGRPATPPMPSPSADEFAPKVLAGFPRLTSTQSPQYGPDMSMNSTNASGADDTVMSVNPEMDDETDVLRRKSSQGHSLRGLFRKMAHRGDDAESMHSRKKRSSEYAPDVSFEDDGQKSFWKRLTRSPKSTSSHKSVKPSSTPPPPVPRLPMSEA